MRGKRCGHGSLFVGRVAFAVWASLGTPKFGRLGKGLELLLAERPGALRAVLPGLKMAGHRRCGEECSKYFLLSATWARGAELLKPRLWEFWGGTFKEDKC